MAVPSRFAALGLAAVLGAAIGALAGVYLIAVRALQHLIWIADLPRLPMAVPIATMVTCTVGGILVGALRGKHDRDAPHDLDDTLLVLDRVVGGQKQPVRPAWVIRGLALGVLSLGFGASLGPEAPLVVLATALGDRVGRLLRLRSHDSAYVSVAGALSGLFGGPLGAIVLPLESSTDAKRTMSMIPQGIVASVTGLITMLLVLPQGHGLRYEFSVVTNILTPGALTWSALAAIPAAAVGLLLVAGIAPGRRILSKAVPHPVLRSSVGGLILGSCGALLPITLFSGEHQGNELVEFALTAGPAALLTIALVNVVATLACLTTGWMGGQIFPAIFSGMAAALAVAGLSGAPVDTLAAAGAGAAATVVLRRPLASAVIVMIFFPANTLVAVVVGVAVGTVVLRAAGTRIPDPHTEPPHSNGSGSPAP